MKPKRRKGYHRALKRGETWAKLEASYNNNMDYFLSQVLLGKLYESTLLSLEMVGLRQIINPEYTKIIYPPLIPIDPSRFQNDIQSKNSTRLRRILIHLRFWKV